MTRKVLLVGINDYGTFAERLTAPADEVARWTELLRKRPYNFEIMPPLINGQATRDAILQAIRELLKGAKKDDQLLFYFAGHGGMVEGRSAAEAEQALMASPGTSGLQDAAIRESEVEALFEQYRPPHGTDITFILDCCHSADYGGLLRLRTMLASTVAATAIPLAVPPMTDVANIRSVRAFGAFAEHEASYEKPVILAATGKYDAAYEITHDRQRRLLFTYRLLWWLRQIRDTFIGIRDNINPLHPDLPQEARLGGNSKRWGERFPGDPSPDEDQRQAETDTPMDTEDAAMCQPCVNLRVLGVATFVNARSSAAPYKARIVLPYDEGQWVPAADRHFACIEIATDDTIGSPQGPLASKWTKKYVRAGVEYKRWSLNGYTVSIGTGDAGAAFERTPDFDYSVPKLTVVAPELQFTDPHPLCFDEAPLLNRFAAFVNLPGGRADVGPPQNQDTRYERRYSGELTYGPRRARRSVKVAVPVISESAFIVLRPYLDPASDYLVVEVKHNATILIANAREVDISGEGVDNDVPREQFLLYYKLAIKEPPDPPLPTLPTIPVDDCTVTDWP